MKNKVKQNRGKTQKKRLRTQTFRRIFLRYFLWTGVIAAILFCIAAYFGMKNYENRYQMERSSVIQKFYKEQMEEIERSDSFSREAEVAEVTAKMIRIDSRKKISNFLYRMDDGSEIASITDHPYMGVTVPGEESSVPYIAEESYSDLIKMIEENKEKCRHEEQMFSDVKVHDIYTAGNQYRFGAVTLSLVDGDGETISTASYDDRPGWGESDQYQHISANTVRLEGPYYADAEVTKANRDYVEQHYDVTNNILSGKWSSYDIIVDSHVFRDSYVITCTPDYYPGLDTDVCMVSVYHYNLWQQCGMAVTGAALGVFLILLLLTLFLSYRQYMLQKTQWEMLSYRKSLVHILAHDLRTPLTAISGYAENIIYASNPEKNEAYLQNIVDNIQHMNELIRHVLELSEELGSQKPHTKQVELADMTEELSLRYAEQAGKKDIRIQQSGKCSLDVNETWFYTVLQNLIGNAVEHGKEGSMVTIHMDKNSYTISNSMQSGNNSKNNRKGMGMGIIREILEYYGILMRISEKNNTFTVSLLFGDRKKEERRRKNMIVDEDAKVIYADYQHLRKKERKIVDNYMKNGYSLVREGPEKVFIAPHNMGIHRDSNLI